MARRSDVRIYRRITYREIPNPNAPKAHAMQAVSFSLICCFRCVSSSDCIASPNSFNRSANCFINPACSAWFFSTISSRSESPPWAFFWSAMPFRIEASFFRRSKTSQTLEVVSMRACRAIWRGMWNIKKELWVTVAPKVVHEDHFLSVNFGHVCDAHSRTEVTHVGERKSTQAKLALRRADDTVHGAAGGICTRA